MLFQKISSSVSVGIAASSLAFLSLNSACAAAPITLVKAKQSPYSIVVPKIAPVSVMDAARELQFCLATATGTTLPIRTEEEAGPGPFISLGKTSQASKAGLSPEAIGYDGFRIMTKGDNLFILGIDTTTEPQGWRTNLPTKEIAHPEIPGPAYTSTGGFSNGTANGVFTFLENQLGVRWLFSGDLGRVVPPKTTFAIEPVDRTEVPKFDVRSLSVVRNADEWRARQKLGFSFRIHYVHNFEALPAELYKTHPDWFPMINGTRPQPPAVNYKLETTNPEVVKFFADKAIKTLKEKPESNTFSLSPSDSRGWSESPESQALYDPPPSGVGAPSMTPLVLQFYRDVAAIVERESPKSYVDGFLYQDFSYPPVKGSKTLPKNFIPVIVGKSMGFNFYRPEVHKLEARLFNEWMKLSPQRMYFYGMPTWLRESSAMVSPAAPGELSTFYSNMAKSGLKGADVSGTFVSSQGALVNYINAKLLWDPNADASAIQRDWLTNAYGPQAGAVMEKLYNHLDKSWWADYFRSELSSHYNVSEAMFENTFGKHYPEMEKLFLEAQSQPMTDPQKQRLDLIKLNMIGLQWRLRNAGYLPYEYKSSLTRSTREIYALMTDKATKDQFSYVLLQPKGGSINPAPVQISRPPAEGGTASPNKGYILLVPTRDGKFNLKPIAVSPGSSFLAYHVMDETGKVAARGLLSQEDEITVDGKSGKPLYLGVWGAGVTLRPRISWQVSIPGGQAAETSFKDNKLYLWNSPAGDSAKAEPSVYVHVPAGNGWEIAAGPGGVTVQTESLATMDGRANMQARKAAEVELQTALKQYGATVVQNLDARWKFSTDPKETGEKDGFASADFDDKNWKTVGTIGYWQNHGFPFYNGVGWYRRVITTTNAETDPLATDNKGLLLYFGAIDGDAEIYLNGQKIGSHVMANHGKGWEVPVVLDVTPSLHTGKNVLSVKVTKRQMAAGIYRGVSLLSGILPKTGKP